ncbi:hypothetical protein HYC85_020084 [Camellia sinensis]|uniref:Uncharacterized protein n=1 Tax=Camellia sinensis TaxID=4442 RepID=A0A7J7GNR8_CAMSI|nr:hypothetical protein HYC85_020084 [Camellia sinensis]
MRSVIPLECLIMTSDREKSQIRDFMITSVLRQKDLKSLKPLGCLYMFSDTELSMHDFISALRLKDLRSLVRLRCPNVNPKSGNTSGSSKF